MHENYTIEKLFNEISDLEVKNDLFNLKIDNIYFWKLIRFNLYKELSIKLGLYETSHPGTKAPKGNIIVKTIRRLTIGVFKGSLRDKKQFDTLIFPHSRKVIIDNKPIDIYTHFKEDFLKNTNESYAIMDRPFAGKFLRKTTKNLYWNEPLTISTLKTFIKNKFNKNRISESPFTFSHIAGISLQSINALSNRNIIQVIDRYSNHYTYYNKLYRYHKPKRIYIVVAYGSEALVSAAQDLGIEVVEIQHGTISQYHSGYSYPHGVTVPYFPDKIELWGKYWFDSSNQPINESKVKYTGFQYLNNELSKYENIKRESNRVLFISQGAIAKELIPIVIKYAKSNPNMNIIYRLHPSEVSVWRGIYPSLKESSEVLDNLSVETHIDMPLYKSFALSKYVVGVYSTALIESIASDCFLIIIKLPGYESFKNIIDRKIVPLVSNSKELEEVILYNNICSTIDTDYFFKKL
ncbi:MAG: hypothetical protein B6229_00525 [Spirochaetaceae bacterium 4572_7]|nr:MAG: hypothetical protein B6229_00525 [Spirochaetaceae bacterium 4572_7]